jgi:hypothetical protein
MNLAFIVLLLTLTSVRVASAESYKVRVTRNINYVAGTNYANDKDKLDIYVPEGTSKTPVVV